MFIKEIVRRMGLARNTLRAALRAESPPRRYGRVSGGSMVDAFKPVIREWLQEHPRMSATVIALRVG